MTQVRTIARFELQRFVQYVVAAHPRLDAGVLCGRAGDPQLLARDGESRVAIERCWDLWQTATELSGDRTIALRFGLDTRLEAMGMLGFAVLTAETAREAIARAARFLGLVSDSGRVDLVETGGRAHVRFVRHGRRTLGHAVANEAVLGQWIAALKQGLGAAPVQGVGLRHTAPPSDARRLERLFDCPVRWGASHDELIFASDLLDRPLATRNAAMSAYFGAEVERLERERARGAGLAGSIRSRVADALVDGEPEVASVAAELGWSERTLRRRLGESDTSFRDLVQDVRKQRAATLLEDPRLSLTEIAFALGFSESSAFTRAARRWFGQSPRAVRAAMRALPAPARGRTGQVAVRTRQE